LDPGERIGGNPRGGTNEKFLLDPAAGPMGRALGSPSTFAQLAPEPGAYRKHNAIRWPGRAPARTRSPVHKIHPFKLRRARHERLRWPATELSR